MKKDCSVGSGNVFADLELPNAEERLAKARLAMQIGKLISKRRFTKAAAGKLLGVDQPRISKLLRGPESIQVLPARGQRDALQFVFDR